MAIWGDTTYVEVVPGSPEGTFTRAGSRCTRIVDVLNPDSPKEGPVTQAHLKQAAKDFVGYAKRELTSGHYWISRITPAPHPEFSRLYCVSIARYEGVAPRGREDIAGEPVAKYARWRCTLEYSTLPYDVLTDNQLANAGALDPYGNPDESTGLRYVSRSGEQGGKFVTIARGVMYFQPGGGLPIPLPEGIPAWISEDTLTLTHYDLPYAAVPWTAIERVKGTINEVGFIQPNQTFTPGTLLYLNTRAMPDTDVLGERIFTLQHQFKYAANIARVQEPLLSGIYPVRGQNWCLGLSRDTPPQLDYYLVASKFPEILPMTKNVAEPDAILLYRQSDFRAIFRP